MELKGLGVGEEAHVREFGSLHSAPIFISYKHRQMYGELGRIH